MIWEKTIQRGNTFFTFSSFLLLGYTISQGIMWAAARLLYPYQVDYGEGVVLTFVQLLAQGKSYFLPITEYPFIHGAYPPIFMMVSVPFYWLFGPSLTSTRSVSIGATLILLYVLYQLIYRLTSRRALSLICTLIFCSAPLVRTWALEGRVDMLAITFSLIGLSQYFFYRDRPEGLKKSLPWFVLALLTKHNAVFALAAVLLDVWFHTDRSRHETIKEVGTYYVLPLVAFAVLGSLITGGEMLKHLFTYSALPFRWFYLQQGYGYFFELFWPAIVVAISGLFLIFKWREHSYKVFAYYFLIHMVGIASMGKDGASPNYLLEPWLSTLLLIPIAVVLIQKVIQKYSGIQKIFPVMIIPFGLILWILFTGYTPFQFSPNTHLIALHHKKEQQYLRDLLRSAPGDVLSEDMTLTINARKPVLLEPFQFLHLAIQHQWNPTPLIHDCERQRFSVILDSWRIAAIPGMKNCLDDYYQAEGIVNNLTIYIPIPISKVKDATL